MTTNSISASFAVNYSGPYAPMRFGATPQQRWRLVGKGEVTVDGQSLLVHGRRSRPFWLSTKQEYSFALTDVLNVVRNGRLIQCQIRRADAKNIPLQFWAQDERSAQELIQLLPGTQTEEFRRQQAERASFSQALEALGTRAIITPALVGANCLMFLVTAVAGAGLLVPDGAAMVRWGTNYGPLTLNGEWWRLLTSMFLHFGVVHLLLNMWALWSVGRLTERLFGSVYFLTLYVLAGLSGSIATLVWHPQVNSAGASGAIFGVLGGLLAFMVNPRTRMPASIAKAQQTSAFVFVAYNLVNGFAHAGIDNACHIGGLIGGFAFGWTLARPLDTADRTNPTPRLAVTLLGGIMVLSMVGWRLEHSSSVSFVARGFTAQERLFVDQIQHFAEDERTAVTQQADLDKLNTSGRLSRREWGRRVSRDILPRWQQAEDHVTAVQLPSESKLAPLQAALVEYLDERRLALQLLGDAAKDDNPGRQEWGMAVLKRSADKAIKVGTLLRTLQIPII